MNIMQMIVSSSILIILIVLIRALTINKLPKSAFLLLWGIVLLRLIVPISIPVESSNIPKFVDVNKMTEEIIGSDVVLPNNLVERSVHSNVQDKSNSNWIINTWIIGAAVLSSFFITVLWTSKRRLSTALPIEDNEFLKAWIKENKIKRNLKVLISDRVSTPLSYGLFNPRIILPKGMKNYTNSELEYVLKHELVHIKRFDVLWKSLAALALCVYWFNPLVWVFYILFNRDIEISCDEKVLKFYGEDLRVSYAKSLITLAEKKESFIMIGNGFSKNALEERIVSIMKYKKSHFIGILCSVILLISATGITVFAFTLTDTNIPNNILNKEIKIPNNMIPGSIMKIDENMDISVVEGGYSSEKSKSDSIFPKAEPGMRIVYDGMGELTKIVNEKNSIYYFMIDPQYQPEFVGHTIFAFESDRNSSTEIFYLDNKNDIKKVEKFLQDKVKEGLITKDQKVSICESLNFQIGTEIELYYYSYRS